MKALRPALGLACGKCGHIAHQHGYQPIEKILERGFTILECLNKGCDEYLKRFKATNELVPVEPVAPGPVV